MFAISKGAAHIQIRRLVFLSVGLVPVALAIVLALFWLKDHVPKWVYWQAALFFLIALKLIYWNVVVLTTIGIVVLGFQFFRGRRPRSRSPAYGFLLCVSLVTSD